MNVAYILPFIAKVFLQKKSILLAGLFASGAFTALVEFLSRHVNDDGHKLTITSLTFLSFVAIVFICIDFVFGILVSRSKKERIVSNKIGITASKMLCVFLFFFLAITVLILISDNYFVLTLIYGPIILTILKEFMSIGENIEIIYGKKLYFFVLIDKMFEVLELKFFKSLESGQINNEKINYEETSNQPPAGE